MAMMTKLLEITEEREEQWQREHRLERRLDSLGFAGDDECAALGLDEMEDEVTMADAERRLKLGIRDERFRYRGIPMSSCTPAEARQAREADIDMTHRAWSDDGE